MPRTVTTIKLVSIIKICTYARHQTFWLSSTPTSQLSFLEPRIDKRDRLFHVPFLYFTILFLSVFFTYFTNLLMKFCINIMIYCIINIMQYIMETNYTNRHFGTLLSYFNSHTNVHLNVFPQASMKLGLGLADESYIIITALNRSSCSKSVVSE